MSRRSRRVKEEDEREDVLELGRDTDAQICKELGGTIGSDKKCRVVHSGVDDEGFVRLRITKRSSYTPPAGSSE